MRAVSGLERLINSISIVAAWATVVPIALFSIIQIPDRKLKIGVSSVLSDMSTGLLFVMIFMLFGFTYLRDGHVRVDFFRRHWSSRTQAKIELVGCLLILIPLSRVLTFYGWDGPDAHHQICRYCCLDVAIRRGVRADTSWFVWRCCHCPQHRFSARSGRCCSSRRTKFATEPSGNSICTCHDERALICCVKVDLAYIAPSTTSRHHKC